jgi:hypothetical protein
MTADPDTPGDEQDQAEAFDETNNTSDGDDIATPDMARDVYDVTSMAADAADDDREAEAEWSDPLDAPVFPERGDIDPDEARAEGAGLAAERNDAVGEPRSFAADNAARVKDGDPQPEDFEGDGLLPESDENTDVEALGYDDEGRPADHDPHVEDQLDEGLKETFPASDPVSINSRSN